jgi:dTDP-4-dehydrorhamnose 3,5-epimerase
MEISKELLPGLYLGNCRSVADHRGEFCKIYNKELFKELGLSFNIFEEFFTTSHAGVIRGMHFTLPPIAQDKLVFCVKGAVVDVMLDLRAGSNYGKFVSVSLDSMRGEFLMIPKGVAHGFKCVENDSVVLYMTNGNYDLSLDSGVHYDSFGFNWGIDSPIVSERDLNLVNFKEFVTPF